ncbi:cytosol aminopeptidase-like [Glossina fuscipes]|uniref:Cytosol aminopeptidase-like n=1 Tax=Glossina fuscipes TaxID=7396 RepID=A0A8U0W8C7_9MUSC|nr:cytosol aminopeptidase-like [Glossina fuscipes]
MHGKLAWQIFFEIRKRCANFQRRFLASHDDSRVTKGLVIGVYQKEGGKDPKLTPSGEKFDDRVQDKVTELVKEFNITGALGKGKVSNNIDQEYKLIAVIGLGRRNESRMHGKCKSCVRGRSSQLANVRLLLAGEISLHITRSYTLHFYLLHTPIIKII